MSENEKDEKDTTMLVVVQYLDSSYVIGEGSRVIGTEELILSNCIQFQILPTVQGENRVIVGIVPFMADGMIHIPFTIIKHWGMADDEGQKFYKTQLEKIKESRSGIGKPSIDDINRVNKSIIH